MTTKLPSFTEFSFDIAPAALGDRVSTELTRATATERLVAWWPGAVLKPTEAHEIPLMVMFFRSLDRPGSPFVRVRIPSDKLGLVRIGSVWFKGQLIGRAVMESVEFDVSFSSGGWESTSVKKEWDVNRSDLIDRDAYPLEFARDESNVLSFVIESQTKRLLIPGLEFLSSCYDRSAALLELLLSGPWADAARQCYLPLQHPAAPNTWPVRLGRRMYNGDAVFLAHALHDPFTQNVVQRLHGQLNVDVPGVSGRKTYSLPVIQPWHEGPARLRVEGIWINAGRTFLALRITGCSEPSGCAIARDRPTRIVIGHRTDADDEGSSVSGATLQSGGVEYEFPDIVDMTDYGQAETGAPTLRVYEEAFVTLGQERTVLDVRGHVVGKPRKPAQLMAGPDTVIGGETRGRAGDEEQGWALGRLSLSAPPLMGILGQVWDALVSLSARDPEALPRAEWFTPDEGFKSGSPRLVSFRQGNSSTPEALPSWAYLDSSNRQPRGLLIARMRGVRRSVYLIEIERRKGPAGEDKENFCGLAFGLNTGDPRGELDALSQLLKITLLPLTQQNSGVFKKFAEKLIPGSRVFKHKVAEGDTLIPLIEGLIEGLGDGLIRTNLRNPGSDNQVRPNEGNKDVQ